MTMALYLENTLSGTRERFEPIDPPNVTIYYCGLTVSDRAHLGHARSWVHVDILRRWLDHEGYDVRYVENFTDVNEKIAARVSERPDFTDEGAVAQYFLEQTLDDMDALGLKRADAHPLVSEHIDEIIDLTERLLERGHAYEADGSVYFDVTSFPEYGQLSNQSLADLEPSEDVHPDKRHPADFALWKAGGLAPEDVAEHIKDEDVDPATAAAGAHTWDSPWGAGRPGWHIECSAMSTTHLGPSFDIHVAGQDIVFPHNENEIAQAEAATSEPYATYWLHVGLLEVDDEKMSSSLGNFHTVAEALEEYGPNVIRTLLLSASHDTRQTFSSATVEEATARWERLDRAYRDAAEIVRSAQARMSVTDTALREAAAEARTESADALNDNLDTRGVLTALGSLVDAINVHLDNDPPYDYSGLHRALTVFEEFGSDVLGLTFGTEVSRDDRLTHLLEELVSYREQLRAEERYDAADALRAHLADAGVHIEDTEDGPTVHFE